MKGFTLLEVVMVTVILIVLAASASIYGLHAMQRAHEAAAFANMRTINTAEIAFQTRNPEIGYGTLKELQDAGLLDEDLGSGAKQGYTFDIVRDRKIPHEVYSITAVPMSKWRGNVSYASNESGTIQLVPKPVTTER